MSRRALEKKADERQFIALKQHLKSRVSLETGIAEDRLEVHHVNRKYTGGDNDRTNLTVLSLPDHAYDHYLSSIAPEPELNVRAELWSAKQVIPRMTLEEFDEFMYKVLNLGAEMAGGGSLNREI